MLVQRGGTLGVVFRCGHSDISPIGVDDRFNGRDSTKRGTLAGTAQKWGEMNSTAGRGTLPAASQPNDKLDNQIK